jgi:hypothetical protein
MPGIPATNSRVLAPEDQRILQAKRLQKCTTARIPVGINARSIGESARSTAGVCHISGTQTMDGGG